MPNITHSPKQNASGNTIPSQYGSNPELSALETHISEQGDQPNITKRLKRNFDQCPRTSDDGPRSSRTSDDKIDDLRISQDNKFDALTKLINTLVEQNKDIKCTIERMSTQYESLLNKVETLELDNNCFKARVQSLEEKLENLEQRSNETSIVIRNVPTKELETKKDLSATIKTIVTTIGGSPPLQELEIKDIYRKKSSAIVVNFTSVARKVNVVSNFRDYNKEKRNKKELQLNSNNINYSGSPKRIYISDLLTTRTAHLHYLARELVKSKKLVAAWTSRGKVLVKTHPDASPIIINEEEDLKNLF